MRIDIITIFPEYFSPLGVSLIGKAAQRGDILFAIHDLRSWAGDVHRTVDDAPFGGGPGMVMKPEPWGEALNAISLLAGDAAATSAPGPDPGTGGAGTGGPGPAPGAVGGQRGAVLPELIVPTPAGEVFTQAAAAELAGAGHLIFACGRYEGIDGRVVEDARKKMRVREITIGDYVLAGGEPAVLVMIEAVCRLLPGVLGNAESAADDSFGAGAGPMSGLVEGPVYTRPRVWRGLEVPPVLVSGDHGQIARWRREQALLRTGRNRPDLATRLSRSGLSDEDHAVLSEAGFADNGEDVAH